MLHALSLPAMSRWLLQESLLEESCVDFFMYIFMAVLLSFLLSGCKNDTTKQNDADKKAMQGLDELKGISKRKAPEEPR